MAPVARRCLHDRDYSGNRRQSVSQTTAITGFGWWYSFASCHLCTCVLKYPDLLISTANRTGISRYLRIERVPCRFHYFRHPLIHRRSERLMENSGRSPKHLGPPGA
jgi:hypothetical protein